MTDKQITETALGLIDAFEEANAEWRRQKDDYNKNFASSPFFFSIDEAAEKRRAAGKEAVSFITEHVYLGDVDALIVDELLYSNPDALREDVIEYMAS